MSVLEDVPFQTQMALLEERIHLLVTPDIHLPRWEQILLETEYGFQLERLILSRVKPKCSTPSCPALCLMPSGTQEPCRLSPPRGRDFWAPSSRPRSQSLNSADSRCLHYHTVGYKIQNSEQDDGYSEDNEGSAGEEPPQRSRSRERPLSAAPRDSSSDYFCPHQYDPAPPLTFRGHEGRPSLRKTYCRLDEHVLQSSPASHCQTTLKKKKRPVVPLGKRFTSTSPSVGLSSSKQPQQRPSSAGPLYRTSRKKGVSSSGPREPFSGSTAELLSALSLEERTLLEGITEKGYPLRTAVMALQKTGYRSPEKVLKYLGASDRLCRLGYDLVQVEEALEMFQNCESKAAEFLHLLTQFNEMGFQQSAIKEVLLVHENNRERALEELVTRMT